MTIEGNLYGKNLGSQLVQMYSVIKNK
jgi:hypothetical protein